MSMCHSVPVAHSSMGTRAPVEQASRGTQEQAPVRASSMQLGWYYSTRRASARVARGTHFQEDPERTCTRISAGRCRMKIYEIF